MTRAPMPLLPLIASGAPGLDGFLLRSSLLLVSRAPEVPHRTEISDRAALIIAMCQREPRAPTERPMPKLMYLSCFQIHISEVCGDRGS
eukprot:1069651-Pyramimonas_sp.AAC.1